MFTGAHNKVRGSIAIVRVQVPGIRRRSPGTLLNWCRLHKTKKQTVTKRAAGGLRVRAGLQAPNRDYACRVFRLKATGYSPLRSQPACAQTASYPDLPRAPVIPLPSCLFATVYSTVQASYCKAPPYSDCPRLAPENISGNHFPKCFQTVCVECLF